MRIIQPKILDSPAEKLNRNENFREEIFKTLGITRELQSWTKLLEKMFSLMCTTKL